MHAFPSSSRRSAYRRDRAPSFSRPVESLERRTLLAVSASLVEIPISAAAVAADPVLANYRSFDLKVSFTPGDRFNVAGFLATLSQGDFYRAPNDVPITNAAAWPVQPNLEFASFVSVHDFGQPPLGVLPYIGTPGTPILTATRFEPVWGMPGGSPAGLNNYTVARITVSGNAVGEIYGEARSIDEPNVGRFFVASLPLGARPLTLVKGEVFSFGAGTPDAVVYDDLNANGALDAGEPSIDPPGRGYTLLLPPGQHRIRVSLPPTHVVAEPVSGVYPLNLADGESATDVNFRIAQVGVASISGRVLLEDPLFGTPTTPMSGVTVFLDHDNNGAIGPGEPQATTDAAGGYSFGQLVPGRYNVRELIDFPYGPAVNQETVRTITIAEGQQVSEFNFRNRRIDVSVIRGFVRTPSNSPLAGWTVYLDKNNSGTLDAGDEQQPTNASGRFEFTVAPGTYALRQVLQAGYQYESPASGSFSVIVAGGNAEERVFVNRLTPTLGRVAGNVKRHAAHYPGSSLALSNWTVYLDGNNNAILDSWERRTSTNSAGDWAFENLAAGTHVVRVSKPSGWRYMSFSTDNYIINLSAGQNAVGRDFVYTQRVMIAGVVFEDLNANGVKNAGEHGVTGRRVWVDLNNDGLISAGEPGGYVGQKGVWGFEDLVAGTYTVRAEAIAGWQNVGTGAYTVTLASGKVVVGVPFGQKRISLPATAGAALPPARNIGVLSPEVDLTAAWARLG